MQIVLAHDSLTQLGGAERVFLALCEEFPDAPVYVVVADKNILSQLPESVRVRIKTSPLQYLYNIYPRFQHLLPFIPLALWLTRIKFVIPDKGSSVTAIRDPEGAFENALNKQSKARIPGSSYFKTLADKQARDDRMILLSSSSAFAKGFRKPDGARHINYCHTPTRFLWTDEEYVTQEVPWLVRSLARIFLWWMKGWDVRASRRVDVFLANSREVQKRIKKYYNRESEVVYPFVDLDHWRVTDYEPRTEKEPYFLIAGRLHAHKHNDLVIQACNELKLNLHVVGSGRDEEYLKSIAGPTVKFLGRVTDEELKKEYLGAEGYIYPQLEDFGLMPLEASACSTPTIGISEGGSRETIVPGKTGEWFLRGDKESLKKLLKSWDKSRYSVRDLLEHARNFSKEKFLQKIRQIVRG